MAAPTTYFRLQELPGFSTIHHAAKPFFKQWFIYTLDVSRIMSVPYAEARQVMLSLRSFYDKAKREAITVEEFCAFTRISKSVVRMHLVSRVMEGELKRQVYKADREKAVGSRQ